MISAKEAKQKTDEAKVAAQLRKEQEERDEARLKKQRDEWAMRTLLPEWQTRIENAIIQATQLGEHKVSIYFNSQEPKIAEFLVAKLKKKGYKGTFTTASGEGGWYRGEYEPGFSSTTIEVSW